ncbi:MAG: hypothetical protein P4N41_11490 [Negativicutes bacterium]|nr:hypothetical protein [Negativicutes bacterium]
MEKIIEQVAAWEFLRQLPAEYAGFTLISEPCVSSSQYTIFSYRKPEDHREFTVVYDDATKDFLARVTVGLNEYYDVSFIAASLANIERSLVQRLERTLDDMANPRGREYESIFRGKNILDWPHAAGLPLELAGFRLFIRPSEALKTINGSYVVIDYSDFALASNLAVYYNIYRDEFFGEVRVNRTPRMINLFDTRELPELAEKLEAGLEPALTDLRREIGGAGHG